MKLFEKINEMKSRFLLLTFLASFNLIGQQTCY